MSNGIADMQQVGRRCTSCMGNHSALVFLPCIGAELCPQCGSVYGATQHEQQRAPVMVLLRHVDSKLTCFISYGHDGLTHVSRHVHKLLSDRGHTVWFDEVSLAHGCDWQKEMEAGIRNALTAGDAGRFIVMLARHGFRRDMETSDAQGFCHREAALAYESMPQRCLAVHLEDMQLPDCLGMANASVLDLRHMFTSRTDELAVDAAKRGGGLTDEQWKDLLNRKPDVKRIMQNIIAAVETGCMNGTCFPLALWKPAATAASALTPSASPRSETPKPSQEKPCRVFVSCDRYAADIGALVAERLRRAGYSVAFDREYCALPLGDPAAEKARAAYVDEAVAWAAGKGDTFGHYKTSENLAGTVLTATDANGAALKPGKLVLLLTPEAVDRRKADSRFGQCLPEFDRAFSMGLRFVPLMLTQGTQPPLAIVGLQWVAFWFGLTNSTSTCEVKEPHPQTISGCLDSLILGLRDGLASEGQHSIMLNRLQRRLLPLQNTADFANFAQESHITSTTMDATVEDWYARSAARAAAGVAGGNVLVVQGAARSGKTAFTVSISHRFRQGVFAAHFASVTDLPSRSLQRASASLMYQAAAGNDAVAASLIENSFLETTFPVMSSQERLSKLLHGIPPSPDGKPRLLLVDSADLVVAKPSDGSSQDINVVDCMTTQLVEALRNAPAHICVVMTVSVVPTKTATGMDALNARCGAATATLSLGDATVDYERKSAMHAYLLEQVGNMAGISVYETSSSTAATPPPAVASGDVPEPPVECTLASKNTGDPHGQGSSPNPQQQLEQQQLIQHAVHCILDRSQGSFEYCQLMLAELRSGEVLSLQNVDAFPPGLNALQALKLQREFPVEDFQRLQGPQLLGVVCAAEEPVGLRDLADMLGVADEVVEAIVERMSALLQVHEDKIKERGAGTLQWLGQQAAAQASQTPGLSVDVVAGHGLLAVWAANGMQAAQQAQHGGNTAEQGFLFAARYAYRFLRRHLGTLHHWGAAASVPQFASLAQWLQQPAFIMEEQCLQVEEEGMSAFFHAFSGVQPSQLRQTAEAALASEPAGAFLLRNTSDGARGVSIVTAAPYGQRVVEHKKVYPVMLPSGPEEQQSVLSAYQNALAFCQLWQQGETHAQQGNIHAQQQLHSQARQQYASMLQQIPQGTPLEQLPQAQHTQLHADAAARGSVWQQCFSVYPLHVLATISATQQDLSGEVFVDLVSLVVYFIRRGQLVRPVKPVDVPTQAAAHVSYAPTYIASATVSDM